MTEIAIRQAPPEMGAYLVKLMKIVGHQEPVTLAVCAAADMPGHIGVTARPDGFVHIRPGKTPVIVLRDNLPSDRWESVVAHEFLHLLRWNVDEWVLRRLPKDEQDAYMRLIESAMKPLTILLLVGGLMNVEWVEEPAQ